MLAVTVLAWVSALAPHQQRVPALSAAAVALAFSGVVNPVLHELGHLGAGVVLGLRVRGMRLLGRSVGADAAGPRNAVTFDLSRPMRALAPRMTLVALAGPAVNIAVALLAVRVVGDDAASPAWRAAAAAVCAHALVLGLGNLLPFRTGLGGHSDGAQVLRWLFGARRRAADLDERRAVRAVALTPTSGDGMDDLLIAARDERATVAAPAVARLLAAAVKAAPVTGQVAAMAAQHDRLLRVLRLPGVEARWVPHLAGFPGMTQAVDVLRRQITTRSAPDPTELQRLSELLEAGLAVDHDELRTRAALALVRGLQDRIDEGRRLLLGVSAAPDRQQALAEVYAVRALLEAEADPPQADRLVAAAERLAPQHSLVGLCRRLVAAAAAHRAAHPGGVAD